jgi:integral membrane protein
MNHSSDLLWLRRSGYAEGISFLVLLGIAMPLKYLAGQPQAVRIVGSAHGALVIIYAVMVLVAARNHQWPAKEIGLGLLAAFLPLGPFWFDKRLSRK